MPEPRRASGGSVLRVVGGRSPSQGCDSRTGHHGCRPGRSYEDTEIPVGGPGTGKPRQYLDAQEQRRVGVDEDRCPHASRETHLRRLSVGPSSVRVWPALYRPVLRPRAGGRDPTFSHAAGTGRTLPLTPPPTTLPGAGIRASGRNGPSRSPSSKNVYQVASSHPRMMRPSRQGLDSAGDRSRAERAEVRRAGRAVARPVPPVLLACWGRRYDFNADPKPSTCSREPSRRTLTY
jgi:hypothetical protein